MKKIITLMCMALLLLIQTSFTGTAEAARVAVAPLQIDDQKIERASDFITFYWDVMVEKFQFPDYELMDDNVVSAVIPENGLSDFDEKTLKKFATDADAEIAVAMRLDSVEVDEDSFALEPVVKVIVKGDYASYNRLTGKYFRRKFSQREEVEPELAFKVDYPQRIFCSSLRRYINQTVKMKSAK